jgi:hypothetical protein
MFIRVPRIGGAGSSPEKNLGNENIFVFNGRWMDDAL